MRLHGCVAAQMEDAILDLLRKCPAHGQIVKPLTKSFNSSGLSVQCEQSENIKRFRMNEVPDQIFQPVENSSGAV